jgi:lysophospholipase L1-like esterase
MTLPAPGRKAPAVRRIGVVAALALLLLGGGLFFHHYWLDLPPGTGPAGPPVPRELFAGPWTDRPVLLLGLGDSVTAGFGSTKGHSYFQRLVRNPPDEWPEMRGISLSTVLPRLRARNLAVSGTTSPYHLETLVARIPQADRRTLGLVVMTTGGNDLIHDYGRTPPRPDAMYGATLAQARPWIAAFEARLGTMLERIRARFPGGCHIFLANIFDPTDGVGDARHMTLPAWRDCIAILHAYNEVIARAAAARPWVHLVDIRTPLLGHGIYCRQWWRSHYHRDDPHYWYSPIFEDPNDRGYDAIRRLFLLEMARVLRETSPQRHGDTARP